MADLAALARIGLLVCFVGVAAGACDTGYKFDIATGPRIPDAGNDRGRLGFDKHVGACR